MAVATGGRTSGPFAVKDHDHLLADTEVGQEEGHLKRAVGAGDLTALGIGAVIGTGIFVVIGEGIGTAGPAVILSFVLAGVTCIFSALCYAELCLRACRACRIPATRPRRLRSRVPLRAGGAGEPGLAAAH